MKPNLSIESRYAGPVAGVDEAGRGPLAGPVYAAAVILHGHVPQGIDDSKKLSAEKRETLYAEIRAAAIVGVGVADVGEIDRLNILGATKLAMERAVEALALKPKAILVDGNQPPKWFYLTEAVVKGDSKSLSIAAASIIAKVERDRFMQRLHEEHPHYGWQGNAGYGTPEHLKALEQHGVTPHHRRSFAPVRRLCEAA